jgi:hypothetical protein
MLLQIAWRRGMAPTEAFQRRRVHDEVLAIAWTISELQALVHDAHQRTDLSHAYLSPRLELRLPIFDAGLRYRIVLSQQDEPGVHLMDEDGKRVADVRLV